MFVCSVTSSQATTAGIRLIRFVETAPSRTANLSFVRRWTAYKSATQEHHRQTEDLQNGYALLRGIGCLGDNVAYQDFTYAIRRFAVKCHAKEQAITTNVTNLYGHTLEYTNSRTIAPRTIFVNRATASKTWN